MDSFNNKALCQALLQAIEACSNPLEEEGGVILKKGDECLFQKLPNIFAGTNTAISLFEADRYAYGDLVIRERLMKGWEEIASFHTHPSFSPEPSSIDRTYLFKGFVKNYIYAPRHSMLTCSYDQDGTLITEYLPKANLL